MKIGIRIALTLVLLCALWVSPAAPRERTAHKLADLTSTQRAAALIALANAEFGFTYPAEHHLLSAGEGGARVPAAEPGGRESMRRFA
jgi:hypothetical protein